MRGELSRSEVSDLVRHLLTGCPECVKVTGRLFKLGDLPLPLGLEEEEGAGAVVRCKWRARGLKGL